MLNITRTNDMKKEPPKIVKKIVIISVSTISSSIFLIKKI